MSSYRPNQTNKTNRIILGIDPGSTVIGYGVIESGSGKMICLEYGILKIKTKEDSLRLLEAKKSFEKLLTRIKPDIIILEKIFFFKNRKTVIEVAKTSGVIISTAAENKIPIIEIAPLELKKSLTSYGGSTKTNIQKMLKLILNLKEEPRPDDAADALALAVLGSGVSGT